MAMLRQTRRCRYYNRGFCKFRDNCNFVHKTGICDKYLRDKICKQGNCDFRHPKPCKFEKNGDTCTWGQNCLYLHKTTENLQTEDLLNPEEKTYSCDIRETSNDYTNDIIDKNNLRQNNEYYLCDQCEYEAISQSLLQEHITASHMHLSCDY